MKIDNKEKLEHNGFTIIIRAVQLYLIVEKKIQVGMRTTLDMVYFKLVPN